MRGGVVKKFLLLLVAFLLALLVMRFESASFADAGENLPPARVWSDGFFVSAACFVSVGVLSLLTNWGGFDSLSYGASFLIARFTRKDSPYKSYFDYVQAKGAERAERKSREGRLQPLNFIIAGLVMLAFSVFAMLAQ